MYNIEDDMDDECSVERLFKNNKCHQILQDGIKRKQFGSTMNIGHESERIKDSNNHQSNSIDLSKILNS